MPKLYSLVSERHPKYSNNTQLLCFFCPQALILCIRFPLTVRLSVFLYGTMIFLPVHNLGDNNVSYPSRTVGAYRCRGMSTPELSSSLSVCAKSNSIQTSSFPSAVCEDTQWQWDSNPRDTVGIHLPGERDDCVSVQKLLHSTINNAAGDDERASKVWDWLPSKRRELVLWERLQLALGLNCRHSSVNSYSIGKPSEPRVSLPPTCC